MLPGEQGFLEVREVLKVQSDSVPRGQSGGERASERKLARERQIMICDSTVN